MSNPEFTYCDSCIFLAYFKDEEDHAEVVAQLLEEVQQDTNRKLLTSIFSITEVAKAAVDKSRTASDLISIEELDTLWENTSLVQLADFHIKLARMARDLVRKHSSLKAKDAVHLATAQLHDASVFFTYDKKLFRLSDSYNFDIEEPYLRQMRLPE